MRTGKRFLLILGAAVLIAFGSPCFAADDSAGSREVIHGTSIPYETTDAAKPAAVEAAAPAARPAGAETGARGGEAEKGGDGKSGESSGLPQLDVATYPSQLFWLFASFAILYFLMGKIALPRVGDMLDARQWHKEGNLKRASQLQEEAMKVKTAYEAAIAKAQAGAQEAQAAAEQEIAERIAARSAEFAESSRKRVAAAEQAIARAKDDALASLADISADVAAEMVNKLADIQVGKAEARKAVATVMKEAA